MHTHPSRVAGRGSLSMRSALAITLLALFFTVLWSSAANAGACSVAGAKTWTGSAGDDNWFTGANWSGGTVPTAAQNVCINLAPSGSEIHVGSGSAVARTLESH